MGMNYASTWAGALEYSEEGGVVGTTQAAEILGVRKSNVRKMLVGYGISGKLVEKGKRRAYVYKQSDVEQVRKQRLTHKRRRSSSA